MEDIAEVIRRSAGSAPPSQGIRFDDWKHAVEAAADTAALIRVVRAYLAAWRFEDLRGLPRDVGALSIESPDDVIARATIATRAEVTAPHGTDTSSLREMSLTLAAAATRLRRLQAARR